MDQKEKNINPGFLTITAIVVVLLLIIVLFFRNNQEVIAPVSSPEDNSSQTENTAESDIEEVKTFNVSAVNYSFSPNEIRVNEGDKVKIILKSENGLHDWVLDEFNVKSTNVNSGETTEVDFVADKKGVFEFYCSIGTHRQKGMIGSFIVE